MLFAIAAVANPVEHDAGIDGRSVEAAVPFFKSIFGVKHAASPAVENFKRNEIGGGKRIAEAEVVVQPVVVGRESRWQKQAVAVQFIAVHHCDADAVGSDAGRTAVAHAERIIEHAGQRRRDVGFAGSGVGYAALGRPRKLCGASLGQFHTHRFAQINERIAGEDAVGAEVQIEDIAFIQAPVIHPEFIYQPNERRFVGAEAIAVADDEIAVVGEVNAAGLQ